MIVSNLPLAQAIIQHFKQANIKHIIISPGSRNAPLTLSFANDDFFKCYSIPDERSAAFFALGIAQQLKYPVAVACTSGSALLNYYPAIAEAFYSQIPIIVLSADRPIEKIDIGDGQTIRQDNVFANHILFSKTLNEIDSSMNDGFIHEAIEKSMINKGPVHLNLPFEEPLYDTVSSISRPFVQKALYIHKNQSFDISSETLDLWANSSKKLILVGDLPTKSISSTLINQLISDDTVLILSEKNSNLHHEKIIDQIDVLITPFNDDQFKKLQPDLLITFGGMIVSKRIKAFLRTYQPKYHIHIDELRAYDTFSCLSHHIKINPEIALNQFINHSKSTNSNYQSYFLNIFSERKIKVISFVSKQPFSDLVAFDLIIKNIPENYHLQIGNSSPIRYLQLFETKTNWEIFCNRGTSGIDGSTSTAIGASQINNKPTILISGDISFFYDINGLWQKYTKENFGIILINNGGGGIFRILPGHQENDVFNEFFETQHQLNASYLAKMYNFDYFEASSIEDLSESFEKIFDKQKTNKAFILEIFTPTQINDKVLKDFFKYL